MRQNVLIALMAVCALLLAANLMKDSSPTPAYGQAASSTHGNIAMATANTQNEVFLFVYNISGTKLASYGVRNAGIELKGVRSLAYDFDPGLNEYPASKKPTAVANMKKTIDAIKRKEKKK